jgi:hypothetical protein
MFLLFGQQPQSRNDGFRLSQFTDVRQCLHELRRYRERPGFVHSLPEHVLPDRTQTLDRSRGVVRQQSGNPTRPKRFKPVPLRPHPPPPAQSSPAPTSPPPQARRDPIELDALEEAVQCSLSLARPLARSIRAAGEIPQTRWRSLLSLNRSDACDCFGDNSIAG